tara:strand:- start:87 stop:884 length:798 start_codon:yes stop_codon:yes gene_type:complete
MINPSNKKRKTVKDLVKKSSIICLTAYTRSIAEIVDEYVDVILVGDSVGTVLYGFESTRDVTLDMMTRHAKTVSDATKKALIVVDMPFGTYEKSKEHAYRNASELLEKSNAGAIKLEGGSEIEETIEYLVKKNINVMGHVGFLPQSIIKKSQNKVFGRLEGDKEKIFKDVDSLKNAGVFSIVIEATMTKLVEEILETYDFPFIGIGASQKCRGQILVTEDLIGLTGFEAKFLKKFCNIRKIIETAVKKYKIDVESKKFPRKNNLY